MAPSAESLHRFQPRHPAAESAFEELRPARRRVIVRVALATILIWSLALRLGFGLRDVHGRTSSDERYNLENIARVVATGQWRPANGYYSFLSWAPQAALAVAVDSLAARLGDGGPILFVDARPTRSAKYLFRAVQAILGTGLVLVVFSLGRELSGSAAGLLAAALASSSWLYVWAGSWIKPDALAALATALAVLWSVRAMRRPTLGRNLLAGVGIGLAISAKLTAALAALPFALAAPFVAGRSPRRWRDLALASGAGLAAYAATAPYFRMNLAYLDGVLKSYARRASASHADFSGVLEDTYGRLLGSLHGPLWMALFWIGVVALAVPAFSARRLSPSRRLALRAVVVLVLAAGPILLLLARAPFLRSNNIYPVMPLATVVASITAVELWRVTARWRAHGGHGVAASIVGLALLAHPIAGGTRWLYLRAVPTTEDLALVSLRGKMTMYPGQAAARIVVHERIPPSEVAWDGSAWRGTAVSAFVAVDSLATIDPRRLERADVEIFPEDRLRGAHADFYRRRMRAVARVDLVRGQFLRARGPDLVILLHPWQEASSSSPAVASSDSPGITRLQLPAATEPQQLFSIVVRRSTRTAPPTTLRHGAHVLPLHPPSLRNRRRRVIAISERFAPSNEKILELSAPHQDTRPTTGRGDILVDIVGWTADVGPSSR